MQKAEKKKSGDRGPHRVLWVLLCAALLVICVAAAIGVNGRKILEDMPKQENTRGSLEQRDTSEIARMTLRLRGRAPWTAIRDGDGVLRLENEADWVPDATLTARVEDALANIVYEAVLTGDPAEYRDHLADFGLSDPELIAEVTYTDGKTVTLRFGNASGLADQSYCYMLVDGDDRLFAAATSLMEDLKVEKELLHPVAQPEIRTALLDRVSVLDGEGAMLKEWMLQGSPTDADAAENWMLTAPFRYPADFDAMVSLRKNTGNLRLGVYVGEATAENLAAYGLAHPARVLEIHMAAGTTGQITAEGVYGVEAREEETLRLEIGDARSDLVDYVRFGNAICTVNHFTLDAIAGAEPLDTVARYPVPVALEALEKLTVETAEGKTVYDLSREAAEGSGTGENGEAETVLHCRKNGTEMDGKAFEAAYQRMLVVTVSGRLPAGWEKGETRVRYTFRTVSGMERVLELSACDAMHDAVTLDGCTVFYLIRDGMGELP